MPSGRLSENSDEAHLGKLGPLPERLIFLLGPHRSGTTYLHQVLVDTGAFDYISYYDLVEFDRLIANQETGRRETVIQSLREEMESFGRTRGIDHMPIHHLHAEEYGFLLEKRYHDLQQTSHISNTDFEPLKTLCRKKRFLSPEQKPLMLKNPTDFYDGFIRIAENFPTAQFLFIHRHPLTVFNSHILMWRSLIKSKNPWLAKIDRSYDAVFDSPKLLQAIHLRTLSPRGLQLVFEKLCNAYDFYLKHIQHLATEDVVSVRYEDLCKTPWDVLRRIIHNLDLPIGEECVDARPSPRKMAILPEVERIYRANAERIEPYLNHLGYAIMPNDL
jgi:hypothetical protein